MTGPRVSGWVSAERDARRSRKWTTRIHCPGMVVVVLIETSPSRSPFTPIHVRLCRPQFASAAIITFCQLALCYHNHVRIVQDKPRLPTLNYRRLSCKTGSSQQWGERGHHLYNHKQVVQTTSPVTRGLRCHASKVPGLATITPADSVWSSTSDGPYSPAAFPSRSSSLLRVRFRRSRRRCTSNWSVLQQIHREPQANSNSYTSTLARGDPCSSTRRSRHPAERQGLVATTEP
ncbi:hypothetical protein C8Q72DRAFT_173894 [Fomitopsis betulina]|nr:hypothetical protein C8Q72DRAFT_173894 [Fomitopsis betulina]